MEQSEKTPREHIAAEIPNLIDDAISVFRKMATVTVPMETKGFAAYLRATNALLDHIDGLVRLKEWTETETPVKRSRTKGDAARRSAEEPEALVEAARRALDARTHPEK